MASTFTVSAIDVLPGGDAPRYSFRLQSLIWCGNPVTSTRRRQARRGAGAGLTSSSTAADNHVPGWACSAGITPSNWRPDPAPELSTAGPCHGRRGGMSPEGRRRPKKTALRTRRRRGVPEPLDRRCAPAVAESPPTAAAVRAQALAGVEGSPERIEYRPPRFRTGAVANAVWAGRSVEGHQIARAGPRRSRSSAVTPPTRCASRRRRRAPISGQLR